MLLPLTQPHLDSSSGGTCTGGTRHHNPQNTPFILVPLTITTVFLFCSINCSICLQLQVVSLPAVELCYYTFKLRLCKETTVRLTWEILMCSSERAGGEKHIFRFLLQAEVRKRPKTKAGLPALQHFFSFRLRLNLCL